MQKTNELEDQIAALKDALLRYPERHIQGAKLNQYIQNVLPDLNVRDAVGIPVGPGALKKFVLTYLSDTLRHVDYNGGDVVYEIQGHSGQDSKPADPNLWKTFVSPSSAEDVVVTEDGSSLARRRPDALQPEDRVVSSVTIAEHNELRERFVEALDPELESRVREAASDVEDYGEWLARIRQVNKSLAKRWGAYRRQGLMGLFKSRLEALDLEPQVVASLEKRLADSQNATREAPPPAVPPQGPLGTTAPKRYYSSNGSSKNGIDLARKLAHASVDTMSYDELRSIRLSLGVVLDAMSEG